MPLPPVYLDHAATTPVRSDVLEAMLPYLNSGSWQSVQCPSVRAGGPRGLEQARKEVAAAVGAEPSQVVFTSGGPRPTTSPSSARWRPGITVVRCWPRYPRWSTRRCWRRRIVAHLGGEEIVLAVDSDGLLDQDALEAALARAAVVSVMWVNTRPGCASRWKKSPGAALPRRAAAQRRGAGVRQGPGGAQRPALHPAHHLRAQDRRPKGIGALIVRDRKAVEAIIHGGGQQFGIRPGTETSPAPWPWADPAWPPPSSPPSRPGWPPPGFSARTARAVVPDLVVHGLAAPRAPHVLSIGIPGTDSEALLMHLDLAGVAASGGSACSTGAMEPSHVLAAMGVPGPSPWVPFA